jgi:2,4-dienoyl-CoA reductase-like NADH-dependent reductase (Old Yellow Enzyme family)
VPTAIMGTYYAQRAAAGLIITEGVGISREGLGWPNAAGLWTEGQVEGWKPVIEAVHQAGGRIIAQLWHMGGWSPRLSWRRVRRCRRAPPPLRSGAHL